MSDFQFDCGDGSILVIPYIRPKDYLEYFLVHCPDVLVGGAKSIQDVGGKLEVFWNGYQQNHGTHPVFSSSESNCLSSSIPLLLHGDEGRGKRRTGTLVVSLESPLGIPELAQKKRKRCHCDCNPPIHHWSKYSSCRTAFPLKPSAHKTIAGMFTNTQGHSFLQRWPLVVIPGVVYKGYPNIIMEFHKLLGQEMRALFYEGVTGPGRQVFIGACIGLKGDMKFHTAIARLTRSYENKGRVRDKSCCHQCLGGAPGVAWEDLSERPCWEATLFSQRPWGAAPPLLPIPFDQHQPEAFYRIDPFHTGKVGCLRDMVGSSIMWMIENDYFGSHGDLPTKLSSAYGAFKLYCSTTKQCAALRSFTKALFQYKSRKSFPWTNTKGSDTMILLRFVMVQSGGFINAPLKAGDLPMLTLIQKTSSAAITYYSRMYQHGLFLSRKCALELYLDGNRFIAGYCNLANLCLGSVNLFGIKPKLHMWRHCLLTIRCCLENGVEHTLNPLVFNCEGNEDAIGRLSRLSRRLDSRGVSGKILECFMVKADILHRRHLQTSKPSKVRAWKLRARRRSSAEKNKYKMIKRQCWEVIPWFDVVGISLFHWDIYYVKTCSYLYLFHHFHLLVNPLSSQHQTKKGAAKAKRQFFLETTLSGWNAWKDCSFGIRLFLSIPGWYRYGNSQLRLQKRFFYTYNNSRNPPKRDMFFHPNECKNETTNAELPDAKKKQPFITCFPHLYLMW